MNKRYRIEEMAGGGWCMVRNHDDELMSIYDTREQAESALCEANAAHDGRRSRTVYGIVGKGDSE